jgi:hypothetical protein
MRSVVSAGLSWSMPFGADPTPSAAWRARCGTIYADENHDADDSDHESEEGTTFRRMRGFLAWKSLSMVNRN